MSMRRRCLPPGWYPEDPDTLQKQLSSWKAPGGAASMPADPGTVAALAPHAGWVFSGRLAAMAAASLPKPAEGSALTVAIFGGHLPSGARALAARESSFDTPLGALDADPELLAALEGQVCLGRDEEEDNTVEVLLPIVALVFPGARVLWLRAPNDLSSMDLGEGLCAAARKIGRRVVGLGSSDLTHYGPAYGFSPKGRGGAAEAWVRGTNDRRFIDALLAMDGSAALSLAAAERSACSPGAAAAALSFARAMGADRARLLGYATSLDARPSDSFVGYAAIAFQKERA